MDLETELITIRGADCLKQLNKLVSMTTFQVTISPIPSRKFDIPFTTKYGQQTTVQVSLSYSDHYREIRLWLYSIFNKYLEFIEEITTEWKKSLVYSKKHINKELLKTHILIHHINGLRTFATDRTYDHGYIGDIPSPEVLIGLLIQDNFFFEIKKFYDSENNK